VHAFILGFGFQAKTAKKSTLKAGKKVKKEDKDGSAKKKVKKEGKEDKSVKEVRSHLQLNFHFPLSTIMSC